MTQTQALEEPGPEGQFGMWGAVIRWSMALALSGYVMHPFPVQCEGKRKQFEELFWYV